MPRHRGDQEGARRVRRQRVSFTGRPRCVSHGRGRPDRAPWQPAAAGAPAGCPTAAAARTERYEIAAYEGLVTMADAMGEDEVSRLLSSNLEQEKAALGNMQAIGKRLAEVGAKAAA